MKFQIQQFHYVRKQQVANVEEIRSCIIFLDVLKEVPCQSA